MLLTYSKAYLKLSSNRRSLQPSLESQLAFWGFETFGQSRSFRIMTRDPATIAIKLMNYCDKRGHALFLSKDLKETIDRHLRQANQVQKARSNGGLFKDGHINKKEREEFNSFLQSKIQRTLREHQVKAALHLISVKNGANFSVPGSGKTSVILSVYEWLRLRGEVDSLFVVGPPSCFWPWRSEFQKVIGRKPNHELLSGISADQRKQKYLTTRGQQSDLYLTTFQTLTNDIQEIEHFFSIQGIRFFLVFDEAHYLKQIGGKWASAALSASQHAYRKCVLTGTPFPKSYTDAFNLFDLLWPAYPPITEDDKHRIQAYCKKKKFADASDILKHSIEPLFYRVRKSDLKLSDQVFNPPIQIDMNPHESVILDYILDRVHKLSESDYCLSYDTSVNLRKGRMMRIRQCLSNCNLLKSAINDYSESIVQIESPLYQLINNYEHLEKPAKLEKLINLTTEILEKNKKVLVWSNFIGTLKLITKTLNAINISTKMIYGGTPTQNAGIESEATRESIISDFINPNSEISVLVANPGACAESISLHKTCSHAIYYDLSYNCAQYLQSLDRIHRVGGSELKPSYYYFLQYRSSLDEDIFQNVSDKARRMENIIGQDYPVYSLDMFNDDEEIDAYERIFGDKQKSI